MLTNICQNVNKYLIKCQLRCQNLTSFAKPLQILTKTCHMCTNTCQISTARLRMLKNSKIKKAKKFAKLNILDHSRESWIA